MFGRFLRRGRTPPAAPPARREQDLAPALTVPEKLALAIARHQAGRLVEAEQSYGEILEADPRNFDALHLVGVIAHQQGDHARAVERISAAISIDSSNPQAQSNLGECYRHLGRAAEAEACYRTAISLRPDYFDAYFNLGLLLSAQGEPAKARDAFRAAIGLRPESASGHNALGRVLHQLGDTAAARASYERALALQPDVADTHNNLGTVLHEQGDWDAASAHYHQALALKPDLAIAHFNLGNLLREQGKQEEAKACYRSALSLQPDLGAAHVNLGNLYREEGRVTDALVHVEEAARLLPDDAAAQLSLGHLLQPLGRLSEAQNAFQRALALYPGSAEAAFGLGIVAVGLGRHEEAVVWFEKAMTFDPEMLAARWALAIVQLRPLYSTVSEMSARRASFAERLGELEAWLDARTVRDGDRTVGTLQPFLLAYHDEPNRDLLARYGRLSAGLMEEWRKQRPVRPTPQPAKRKTRLRVGIASAQIYEHSVWSAIVRGWFAHLDGTRFELHAFHLGTKADGETAYARSRSARFDQGPRTLEQWIDLIAARQLDALIYPEVGMDTMTARLASLRLVPVQAASWGHPETTGLPTIDYYLSGEDFEPPQAQSNYTERLVALPHLGCTVSPYRGPVVAPDFASLGLDRRGPVLLCPGTPIKYTPASDAPLVEIARQLGRCRLVFFTHHLTHLSEQLRGRLAVAFERAGLDPAEYLTFVPWQSRPAFYGLMQRADVYLDTIGFSGFNTAMQALECGLPVVTREGRFLRGRLASGLLRRAGLSELVADSAEAYVDIAVRLARDGTYRGDLRSRIATARAVLHDDLVPARALETFLADACSRG